MTVHATPQTWFFLGFCAVLLLVLLAALIPRRRRND